RRYSCTSLNRFNRFCRSNCSGDTVHVNSTINRLEDDELFDVFREHSEEFALPSVPLTAPESSHLRRTGSEESNRELDHSKELNDANFMDFHDDDKVSRFAVFAHNHGTGNGASECNDEEAVTK